MRMLLNDMKRALERGVKIRILTGNYLGITQPSALYLIKSELGDRVDLRLYNETSRSFHPKSYIFHYESSNEIYIGSSNISKSALTSGIEWNYRFSDTLDKKNYELFYATFEDLFLNHSIIIDDEELKRYSKAWKKPAVSKDLAKYDATEDGEDRNAENVRMLYRPRGAQIEALYALQESRMEGAAKGLVYAATGIGKTYLAAFDSAKYKRVLFVAHREEILKQAVVSFKNVRNSADYGFFDGKEKDRDKSVIFASVATLGRTEYLNETYFPADYFEYVIIDEFHHAVTDQYRRIVEYFQPQFLLGLTATPERMDGKNIYEICDYNVPYQISLKEAINKGMLVPFHYYGVYDETDYSGLRIVKGRYDEQELNQAYIGNERRYDLIYKYYRKYRSLRAIGFCCSRQHAEDMAKEFCQRGIASAAVYSGENGAYAEERNEAIRKLKNGEIRVIFSVDMFNPVLEEFEAQLLKTDHELTGLYSKVFEEIVGKVKRFGGTKENETIIQINSTLGRQELIKDNTVMTYKSGDQELPESYNGLGYLNLISIIIQIETIMAEFRCDSDKEKMPADINILFIEEPEAHTHPQLQYIFIKNIKELLREGKKCKDGSDIVVQTLITTHSSHIVAECDFDDIKYFCRVSPYAVISKNLCSLEAEYKDETDPNNKRYKFLKQYLTLNYAEVFFADKVILYEGDTERILLPAMMRKIDQEEKASGMPLLSQNISIIAAGANSQLFSPLLAFLDIKTLIITDIDAVKKKEIKGKGTYYVACEVEKGEKTSNHALNYYFKEALENWGRNDLTFFKKQNARQKVLSYIQKNWQQNEDGKLMIAYQTKEENGKEYYPRSFEDAFFCCNRQFIIDNISNFHCLKNKKYFDEKDESGIYQYSPYELAEKCVKSKPAFPMEVLLNSESDGKCDYSNWKIPSYIKEGLLWLKQD